MTLENRITEEQARDIWARAIASVQPMEFPYRDTAETVRNWTDENPFMEPDSVRAGILGVVDDIADGERWGYRCQELYSRAVSICEAAEGMFRALLGKETATA